MSSLIEEECDIGVSDSKSTEEIGIDESKIDVAIRFLNNVKVQGTEKEQKIRFLKSKGLSDVEVDHAFSKIYATKGDSFENDSSGWSLFDYFKGIILGAGILSAANYAYKAYFLPYVAQEMKDDSRIETLGESVQVLKDDIKQNSYELTSILKRLQDLIEQQQTLLTNINNELKNGTLDQQKSLSDVKAELVNVKSMMLSRRQFPVVPFSPQSTTEIPAWQLASEGSTTTESKSLEVDESDEVKTAEA